MTVDARITGDYLFYKFPKPAGGFPSLAMAAVLVNMKRSRLNYKLRLTSPHGCNMIWDFYRGDWGEHKSCESQPAFKHRRLGWRKLFSVWSVQGTPTVQPYRPW